MNLVPASDTLPDRLSAYDRASIASDVEHLRPHAETLARHPGLTRDHLAAAALALVGAIDADLESMATGGPAADPRERIHPARRKCEIRDALLSYAGRPQTRQEARKVRALATLRAQVLNSPLVAPGQPGYALAGLARSWGTVELGPAAAAILAEAMRSATPAIRSHLTASSPDYPRFLRIRAELPAAEARAEFGGEGSPASARLESLRADLADARSRAEAEAGRVIAGLAGRLGRGELDAFVEAAAMHEAAADGPSGELNMRARLLEALTVEGPERFIPMGPDWPPAPEPERPAEAPADNTDWGRVGPTPRPNKRRDHGKV